MNPVIATNAANCQYQGVDCQDISLPLTGFDVGLLIALVIAIIALGFVLRRVDKRTDRDA